MAKFYRSAVLAMKNFRIFIFVIWSATLSCAVWPTAAAESIAIVTQRDNPVNTLTVDTLKMVYLRKLLLDNNGIRWIALNLPSSNELRQKFSMALFKKLPEEQEDYWNEQYFNGITPPQVLSSEEAVLRFVEMTPGAIGYVSEDKVDGRVKVLKIIPTP
jgi:ABC-type phosphate transport system substrate-binding protein